MKNKLTGKVKKSHFFYKFRKGFIKLYVNCNMLKITITYPMVSNMSKFMVDTSTINLKKEKK